MPRLLFCFCLHDEEKGGSERPLNTQMFVKMGKKKTAYIISGYSSQFLGTV